MQAQDSEAIIEKLRTFTQAGPNGATIRLDSTTDFAWDKVYGFDGTAPTDFITKMMGRHVTLTDEVKAKSTSNSALLIFTKGGDIVHQMAVAPGINQPPLFIVGLLGKDYTPDNAVLSVHTKDPGPYAALRFLD
ncbi:MAG: hypothetical protein AAGA73_00335 [Pseudomonadota bacterium]